MYGYTIISTHSLGICTKIAYVLFPRDLKILPVYYPCLLQCIRRENENHKSSEIIKKVSEFAETSYTQLGDNG